MSDISFKLKVYNIENETLLIKGPSGSGKSSFLMNVIGVLKGHAGKIYWGGIDIKKIDGEKFRSKIGYLGPEPYLIKGTILENLVFGLDAVPKSDEINKALKISKSDTFINNGHLSLNSEINEFGEGLSMGQKQRIGLARALLRKPTILIFDEITANLDKQTENEIVKNLSLLKKGFTILIASHSDAFDSFSDKMIILENVK